MAFRECTQCNAISADGTRCHRITCTIGDLCAKHMLSIHHLLLKKSQIPSSGKGLYTSRAIPANTDITEYTGAFVPLDVYARTNSGYGVAVKDGTMVIDANSTQHGIARYANDCRPEDVVAGHCPGNNAYIFEYGSEGDRPPKLTLRTSEPLEAGSEIFVDYGGNYWKEDATKHANKKKIKKQHERVWRTHGLLFQKPPTR